MRLFVAIELPARVRTAVEDVVGRWRSTLPKARWVRGENLHLTLAFLGELAEERLPALAGGVERGLAGCAPFTMRVQRSGRFPERGRARVAWLGFADCPEVVALHARLSAALRGAIGYEPEKRPFQPHLTVARCAPPWPAAAGRTWASAVPGSVGEAFRVGSVGLIQSRLGAGGAVYSNLHRFALGKAA